MKMTHEEIILNGKTFSKNNLKELKQILASGHSWQHAIYDFLKNWFDETETITVYTSGSTGKPKEIRLTKTAMRNSARMTNAFFTLNSTTTALLCLPASYIAGKMMLVRALVGGYNLISVEPNAHPFKNLNQSIDFAAVTPYQLMHSLEEIKKIENWKLKNGKIIVGGAKINSETETALQSLKTSFYETYGMTETCSHIALRAVNGNNKSDCFRVLSGVSVRKNENDCLCITAPHLLDKEIVTNDVVEFFDHKQFKIIGRFDNIINSGGIKLNPEQIEQKLEKHIAHPFFISSAPDEQLGNKVILVIETAPLNPKAESKLKSDFELTLEKYERPKQIIYIPKFSYSASNKLLKAETLQCLHDNHSKTHE